MAYKILAGLENWLHNSILASKVRFNILDLNTYLPEAFKGGLYQRCPKGLTGDAKKLCEFRDEVYDIYHISGRITPLHIETSSGKIDRLMHWGGVPRQEDCDEVLKHILLLKYFSVEGSNHGGLQCKKLLGAKDGRRSIRTDSDWRIIYINSGGKLYLGYLGSHAGYNKACNNQKLFG